jgi:DMSO/TMAO reductase YedYZ molybdopterin-dependent catalytic subunit
MPMRRDILSATGAVAAIIGAGGLASRFGLAAPYLGPSTLPSGTLASSTLEALPGKQPLIKRSYRPPNYETPIDVFNEAYTPNDRFFVRYHLADIPEVDGSAWRLKIGGEGAGTPFELSLDQLASEFERVELAAVCQCSGNRRGLSTPPVMGVQWGYGAMGNAKWKGARLKDILAKVGMSKDVIEVTFDGADKGILDKTPDFIKSIPVWKAMDENTLIATHMNGEPLPHWNGYPARLVVPGWTATYWVKNLTQISVLTNPYQNFWMNPAYRVPLGKFPIIDRFVSQDTATTTPITEMVVNSLITNMLDGHSVPGGQATEVRGIAWDGGYGIARVEVSTDDGKTWHEATLEADLGRFAWRQWSYGFTPQAKGRQPIMVRATNSRGATQTSQLIWNPAGYHNNVIQRIMIDVV